MTKQELVREVISRSVEKIYPSREALEKVLLGGRKLRLYLGVDPTGPHLHLGHLTNLLVLKRFQALGHKVIFLIGDFTGRIGDPSGRDTARKPLSESEVKNNLKTFRGQASRIVKFSRKNAAQVLFNSKWHKTLRFGGVLEIARHFTVGQIIKRDMFRRRLREGKDINLVEFLYPLMQGYDSVVLNVDLEVGGTDQTFNMLRGRDLMKAYRNKEKFVLTTKLLENPKTGKKLMNKSEGGLINLDDEASEIFGKVMALPDEAIRPLAELSTEMPIEEVQSLGRMRPKDAKAKVGEAVVEAVWGPRAAREAASKFDKLFSRKETTGKLPFLKIKEKMAVVDLVISAGAAKSRSEARRLIIQGGVRVDGKAKLNPGDILNLKGGEVLKVGKKKFFRIRSS